LHALLSGVAFLFLLIFGSQLSTKILDLSGQELLFLFQVLLLLGVPFAFVIKVADNLVLVLELILELTKAVRRFREAILKGTRCPLYQGLNYLVGGFDNSLKLI